MRGVHFVILSNVLLKTSSRKEEWIFWSLAQELTWTEEGGRTFSFISTSPGLKHDLKAECWAVINTSDTINWDMMAEEMEIHSKRREIVYLWAEEAPKWNCRGAFVLFQGAEICSSCSRARCSSHFSLMFHFTSAIKGKPWHWETQVCT